MKNKKLLLSRSKNKDVFIAPGGKIEEDESPENALARELQEELKIDIQKDDLEKFGMFYAPAAGNEDSMLRMDVFIVRNWDGEITPDSEIEEIIWVDSNYSKEMEIGSIFEHEVIPKLKSRSLID